MKILKKLFLLCIPCVMFFSCESTEQRYILSERVPKSEACKYYEEKIHGILTVNDYKNGKYLLAGLDGSSSTSILIKAMSECIGKTDGKNNIYSYETITKLCPVTHRNGVVYFENKKFSFTMIEALGDDGEPTGKYSFMMVDEENADVNNFITEDASLTGDILSLADEKTIFDPMVEKIVDELKEQDIFNDKSAQPLSKSIDGIDCKVFGNREQGAYENSEYLTLRVDVPYFVYNGKSGSLYFYILHYNVGIDSYVTVEGAIIYGNKKKFIYKDYDGKLKD